MTGAARPPIRPIPAALAVLAFAAALGAPPVAAQVNTEQFRSAAKEEGVSGSMELSFANRTGNTDLQEGGAAIQVGVRRGPRMGLFITDVSVGNARGTSTIDRGFAHLRGGYALWPRLMAEAFVQHEYDRFAKLNARSLLGAGPRFTLYRSDAVAAHLGVAFMLEWERLDVPAGGPDPRSDHARRISSYLSLHGRLSDRLSAVNTLYVQPRIGNADDVRVLEEASLKVGIAGPMSLKVSFNLRYDGAPPAGVRPVDTSLSNRLVWDF